jgi:hypothetical protein
MVSQWFIVTLFCGCLKTRSHINNINKQFNCNNFLEKTSSAHHSPLLDIDLSNCSPSRSIFGYSHSAPSSRPAQIVSTPPGSRASYTTFTETRSPLQNSFTPTVVGSTADMASPLPLQSANTVCYVGDIAR